jgi:hypothetical protein
MVTEMLTEMVARTHATEPTSDAFDRDLECVGPGVFTPEQENALCLAIEAHRSKIYSIGRAEFDASVDLAMLRYLEAEKLEALQAQGDLAPEVLRGQSMELASDTDGRSI